MFHVKHRALVVVLVALALLGVACAGAAGSRGWAPPVRSENLLLVSAEKGRLPAIDVQTRALRWTFPDDWRIEDGKARKLRGIYAAPIVIGDVIYLADYNGFVYRFRPSEAKPNSPDAGQLEATSKRVGSPLFGLTHDRARNVLYATAKDGGVYEIAGPGEELRVALVTQTKGEIWSSPALHRSSLYVGTMEGRLVALEAATGRASWSFDAGAALSASPVIEQGAVLVGGFNGRLHALAAGDGSERWSFKAGNWIWSTPVIDGDRAYVSDFDGRLYALDVAPGRELWSLKLTDAPIRSAPAVTQGIIVVADDDGKLHPIDAATRERKWPQQELGTRVRANLLPEGGTVYLAPNGCSRPIEGGERVYFLSVDVQSGRLSSISEVC